MALIPDVLEDDPIEPSWGNSIRDQGVQVCTSTTRPSPASEGMVIYETDTDHFALYNGSGWIEIAKCTSGGDTWTPTVTQNVARAGTTNLGKYQRSGTHVTASLHWTCSVTGSANAIFLSAPGGFSPQGTALNELVIGRFHFYDVSVGGAPSNGLCIATTSGIGLIVDGNSSFLATTLGSGDKLTLDLGFFV